MNDKDCGWEVCNCPYQYRCNFSPLIGFCGHNVALLVLCSYELQRIEKLQTSPLLLVRTQWCPEEDGGKSQSLCRNE